MIDGKGQGLDMRRDMEGTGLVGRGIPHMVESWSVLGSYRYFSCPPLQEGGAPVLSKQSLRSCSDIPSLESGSGLSQGDIVP